MTLTDDLPAGVSYAGGLAASSGTASQAGGVISWTGSVPGGVPVTIIFTARVDAGGAAPTRIVNTALLDDGAGNEYALEAVTYINGYALYLPSITNSP